MNEKKVSILLVDDTAYNIMILEEFLDADYKLSSAVDVNTTQKAQLFAEYLNNKIITYQKSSPKNDSN